MLGSKSARRLQAPGATSACCCCGARSCHAGPGTEPVLSAGWHGCRALAHAGLAHTGVCKRQHTVTHSSGNQSSATQLMQGRTYWTCCRLACVCMRAGQECACRYLPVSPTPTLSGSDRRGRRCHAAAREYVGWRLEGVRALPSKGSTSAGRAPTHSGSLGRATANVHAHRPETCSCAHAQTQGRTIGNRFQHRACHASRQALDQRRTVQSDPGPGQQDSNNKQVRMRARPKAGCSVSQPEQATTAVYREGS